LKFLLQGRCSTVCSTFVRSFMALLLSLLNRPSFCVVFVAAVWCAPFCGAVGLTEKMCEACVDTRSAERDGATLLMTAA